MSKSLDEKLESRIQELRKIMDRNDNEDVFSASSYRRGWNELKEALSEAAPELDEIALKDTAENYARSIANPEKYFEKEAKDFSAGARWQFDKCRAEIGYRTQRHMEILNSANLWAARANELEKELAEAKAEIERLR